MKPILFLFSVMFCWSCNKAVKTSCENLICTMEFRAVGVKFIDANGRPLVVKDFKSINLRTGKEFTNLNNIDTVYFKGYYNIVTDANTNELATEGDKIKVSARHPISGVLK
jgi:hypothetical protein